MNLFTKDLAERAIVSFVEGFLSGLVITGITDKSTWLAAVAGGVSSVASLLKSSVARGVGNTGSASLNKNI